MPSPQFDDTIVGGGFFGASLALSLRRTNRRVALIERESDLLTRASLVNQARIHGGYHYPRSLVTGLRSRENFWKFANYFSDCVDRSFKKYYAISRYCSSITAHQFVLFCERIGAPLSPAPAAVVSKFNPDMIEAVFEVEEFAFDAVKLRRRLMVELEEAGVSVMCGTHAHKVSAQGDLLRLEVEHPGASSGEIDSGSVYLCLYGATNRFLFDSKLPQIPLRQEYTEMCLVKAPGFLEHSGVTVMCGPFFSVMPYPSRGVHSFSHVRYTPHFSWPENDETGDPKRFYDLSSPPQSKYLHMLRDAERYIPEVGKLEYLESIWESKALLPRNEQDDARPILLKRDHGLRNLTCIIGAKIDNIFDVHEALSLQ